VQNSTQNNL